MENSFDRASFYSKLWKLMLPVVLQNLLSAVVNTADVFMLSGVSQNALSASSLAGQVGFVLMLFYFGLSTGASVLAAQYWGRKDRVTIGKIQALALRYSAAVSFLFFVAALAVPEQLMRVFTNDGVLVSLGIGYLRWVSVSYLMLGVSQIVLAVMKSLGETKLSAQISMACLFCNVALNALAIYALFPGQEYAALCGVAAATAVSRVAELALCLAAIRRGKSVRILPREALRSERWLVRDFWKCTLPVQANFLIWGCATAAISAILGHIGSEIVAANSLASTLRSLVIVGCSGLGVAGSIMVGQLLGRNDFESARWVGRKMFSGSLLLGAASGLLLLPLYWPCMAISRLDGEAAELFKWMLVINAVYCIGKSFNASMVSGLFCAGGDTRFGLVCDTIAMWGVILPAGYIAAFVLGLPPIAVYAVMCMDEFVKLPFVAHRFRKYRWLKNLTRAEAPEE